MTLREQPYLPLYVQDFLCDEKLANCSAAATGVYIRLMCLLHKSEFYGRFILSESDKRKAKSKQTEKQTTKQSIKQIESNAFVFAFKLQRFMPYQSDEIANALIELEEEGVITIDENEITQKRMVRDGELSKKRSLSGGLGGKAKKKEKQNKSKEGSKIESKEESKNKANAENEYEYENEYINIDNKGVQGEKKETENRKFLTEFFSENKRAQIETLCMQLFVSPEQLCKAAEGIIAEWELSETTHESFNDWAKHLINQLRIKIKVGNGNSREQKAGTAGTTDRYSGICEPVTQKKPRRSTL